MKIKAFGLALTINVSICRVDNDKYFAKQILLELERKRENDTKIARIKMARKLLRNMTLKEAKELVEKLFEDDGNGAIR